MRSHGMRQVCQPQFFKAGQKLVQMLLAEQPKHPIADNLLAFLDRNHQLQAKEILVMHMGLHIDRIQISHDPPSRLRIR